MQELLLVNPRARRKVGARKHRTAAQTAATRRMVAANRARRGGHVAAKRKRRVSRAVTTYAANPIRRRHNPSRARHHVVSHRRYKRNPIGTMGGITPMLARSFQGAVGGLAINTAFGYIPLPASMKTGNMSFISKAALAILVGVAGRKIMPSNVAANMAVGSLTITMHDAMVSLLGGMIPGVTLSGVGYYTGGYPASAVPARLSSPAPRAKNMGEYVRNSQMSGVGIPL